MYLDPAVGRSPVRRTHSGGQQTEPRVRDMLFHKDCWPSGETERLFVLQSEADRGASTEDAKRSVVLCTSCSFHAQLSLTCCVLESDGCH